METVLGGEKSHEEFLTSFTTSQQPLIFVFSLQIPSETRAKLSPECIDFLSCLLAGPETRIGSSVEDSTSYLNGFAQIVKHPWFADFDWDGLSSRDGPLLPAGSAEIPSLLEYLR